MKFKDFKMYSLPTTQYSISYKDFKKDNQTDGVCKKCMESSVTPPAGDPEELYAVISSGEDFLMFRPSVVSFKDGTRHLVLLINRMTIKLCDLKNIDGDL